jgi:hypothetical protein
VTERVLLPIDVTDASLSEADFEVLEKAGGIALSSQQRERILHLIVWHKQLMELYKNSPRVSEVTPWLKAIEICTKELIRLLKQPSFSDVEQAGALRLIRDEALRLGLGATFLKQVEATVQELGNAATGAIEGLPADFGPGTDDPYLHHLIATLHSEFCLAGGVGKTSKKSLAFLDEGCRLAGVRWPKDRNWEALKTSVRRALRDKSLVISA